MSIYCIILSVRKKNTKSLRLIPNTSYTYIHIHIYIYIPIIKLLHLPIELVIMSDVSTTTQASFTTSNNKDLCHPSTKSKEARTGRDNQRYNSTTGARIVSGCICLNSTKDKVVMISSSKHKHRWILPKGGNETDETEMETAIRETWEEAGVEGKIIKNLPVVLDSRGQKAPVIKGDFNESDGPVPKSEFHFFEMQVEELSMEWPEQKKRERRWCTYSEARHELIKLKRPELVTALNSSSIIKDTNDENDEY